MKVMILNLSWHDPVKLIKKILKRYSFCESQILILDLIFSSPIEFSNQQIPRRMLKEYMSDDLVEELSDWVGGVVGRLEAAKLLEYECFSLGENIQFDLAVGLIQNNANLLLLNKIIEVEKPSKLEVIMDKPFFVGEKEIAKLSDLRRIPLRIQRISKNPLFPMFQ